MIEGFSTEEYLSDFVDGYAQFGINIVSHKTKIAKRTYLQLLLFLLLMITIIFLQFTSSSFQGFFLYFTRDRYWISLIALASSTVLLLVISENSKKIWLIFLYPICAILVLSSTLLLAYLIINLDLIFPYQGKSYLLFVLHHVCMTLLVVSREEFSYKIFQANLFLFVVEGMIVLIVGLGSVKWVTILLFLTQLFLTNVFYFLMIQFFQIFHQKKYWRNRKFLSSFLIFIFSNASPLTVLLLFCFIFFLWVKKC